MSSYDEAYTLLEEIYENFSRVDKLWFMGEGPTLMHSSLGRHLRNHAKLWESTWEPVLVQGVDCSPNHPDAISQKVIIDFQKVVKQNEAFERKQGGDD